MLSPHDGSHDVIQLPVSKQARVLCVEGGARFLEASGVEIGFFGVSGMGIGFLFGSGIAVLLEGVRVPESREMGPSLWMKTQIVYTTERILY